MLVRFVVGDHANAGAASGAGLVRDSLGGIREVFAERERARLLLLSWFVAMFSVSPEALAAPYVAKHHGSAALVGWWLCALPVGTVTGDVLGVRFASPALQRRLVFGVAAAGFVPYLFFVANPVVPVAIALLVVSGLTGMYALGLDGRVRDAVPDRLFPRVMALNQAGLMTLQGIGFALAGAIAEATGAGVAIAIAGVAGVAVVACLAAFRRPHAGTSGGLPNLST
jgi:hypothetical protein